MFKIVMNTLSFVPPMVVVDYMGSLLAFLWFRWSHAGEGPRTLRQVHILKTCFFVVAARGMVRVVFQQYV